MDAKTLCLGALRLGACTGYDIKKIFEEGPLSHIYSTGFGSIYPALNALVGDGLIEMTMDAPDNVGPTKKNYRLTPRGEQALQNNINIPCSADKFRSDFLFSLLFADLIDGDVLKQNFETYRSTYGNYVSLLKDLMDEDVPAHRKFVRGLGLATYQAALSYMEENTHLLFEDETAAPKTPALNALGE